MHVTRRFRLCSLVLLVCVASTNVEAQNDLLWQHADGRRALWTMTDTIMDRGDLINTGLLTDPLWQAVATDRYSSVLFQHQGDGRLAGWSIFCGYFDRTFELSPSQVSDLNWKVRGYGFSGHFKDHYRYLLWQNEVTGEIAAWKMGGDGTTVVDAQPLTPSEVPDTNWRIVAVDDFNSDGHSDLLWQHQTSGLIALWYMNGLTKIEGGGVLLSPGQVPDTNWKIRATGYVNADFHPDLIWQHQTTGLVSAWLMKGRQLVDGVLLTPDTVADTNWRIVGSLWRNYWDCGY
jgi:hypothetical protein